MLGIAPVMLKEAQPLTLKFNCPLRYFTVTTKLTKYHEANQSLIRAKMANRNY